MKQTMLAAAFVALTMGLAAPAYADVDTDFSRELRSHGIYGPRDYNAWLGKIVCKRLDIGQDPDANAAVRFIHPNLDRDTTQAQAWEFLGVTINTYCPDKRPVYEAAAG